MAALVLPTSDTRRQALRSLDKLPPFSPVLQRLLAKLLNPDILIAELADLVEKDAVLTSYVLRLVNSAAMGRRGTVTSVGHAIALMGLVKLRNALISFSVCQLWTRMEAPACWSGARFNLHSVATAVIADLLAQSVKVDYAEGAFVSGMLHDLGKLLLAISFPSEWEQVRKEYCGSAEPWHILEDRVFHVNHSSLSAAALERWNLPVQVREAVEHHHDRWPDVVRGGAGPVPLGQLIQVADEYVNAHGLALYVKDPEPEPCPGLLSRRLGLDEKTEQRIEANFASELKYLGGFFGK